MKYNRDEWSIWQQGKCGTYALALMRLRSDLRFGGVDFFPEPGFDNPQHFVAHSDTHAYDSAGEHPLPYRGIDGTGVWLPDLGDPKHWGIPEDEASIHDEGMERTIAKAQDHARRHGILEGRWPQ